MRKKVENDSEIIKTNNRIFSLIKIGDVGDSDSENFFMPPRAS